MNASDIFEKSTADALPATSIAEARQWLVQTLAEATGLPLTQVFPDDRVFHIPIRCEFAGNPELMLCWDGFINRTTYREDKQYSYGAYLFLYSGPTRLMPGDHSYRYFVFEASESYVAGWRDCGWQFDEFDEWGDRELAR